MLIELRPCCDLIMPVPCHVLDESCQLCDQTTPMPCISSAKGDALRANNWFLCIMPVGASKCNRATHPGRRHEGDAAQLVEHMRRKQRIGLGGQVRRQQLCSLQAAAQR